MSLPSDIRILLYFSPTIETHATFTRNSFPDQRSIVPAVTESTLKQGEHALCSPCYETREQAQPPCSPHHASREREQPLCSSCHAPRDGEQRVCSSCGKSDREEQPGCSFCRVSRRREQSGCSCSRSLKSIARATNSSAPKPILSEWAAKISEMEAFRWVREPKRPSSEG